MWNYKNNNMFFMQHPNWFEEIFCSFRLCLKQTLKYHFLVYFHHIFHHVFPFHRHISHYLYISNLLCVISCFYNIFYTVFKALHHLRFEYYAVCQTRDQFLSFILYYFREGQYRMFVSLLLSGVSVCFSMCSVWLLSLYGNTTFSGSISNVSSATMWLVQVLDRAR